MDRCGILWLCRPVQFTRPSDHQVLHANIRCKHSIKNRLHVFVFIELNILRLHLEFDIFAFLLLLYLDWGQLLYAKQCIYLSSDDGQRWIEIGAHFACSLICRIQVALIFVEWMHSDRFQGFDIRHQTHRTPLLSISAISSAQCIILLHICIHQILSTD